MDFCTVHRYIHLVFVDSPLQDRNSIHPFHSLSIKFQRRLSKSSRWVILCPFSRFAGRRVGMRMISFFFGGVGGYGGGGLNEAWEKKKKGGHRGKMQLHYHPSPIILNSSNACNFSFGRKKTLFPR